MTAGATPESVRFRRIAFWVYAAILFAGTHWPRLRLPGTGRPDLLIHLSIFGVWTAILIAAGFFGPPLSGRNIGRAAIISPVYAAIDEAMQAIPFVHRTAAVDDWAFNCIGIFIAVITAWALSWTRRDGPGPRDGISSRP